MTLEPGPSRPDPSVAAAVDEAAAALLGVWDAARERATNRLSGVQLRALLIVEKRQGLNLGGLAGQLGMILSSASRLCDRLVAAGLLERAPGRADRREITLTLTPSSLALLSEVRGERREQLRRVLDLMSPGDRTALLSGLREFATAAGPTAEEPTAARSA